MSQTAEKISILPAPARAAGPMSHYNQCLRASFGQSLMLMLRRQRVILAAAIAMLPVLIPLAMAFLSSNHAGDSGLDVFTRLAREAHVGVLAPLLALFFATMIVGEDVEGRTIPLMLTRPMPRSAWVLGRYAAYLLVSGAILGSSLFLTFAASTALPDLAFDSDGLGRLAANEFAMFMALAANGAFALFLGAVTRRPIIIGVLVLYGWQRIAVTVPGIVDFLTILKYTNELLPAAVQATTEAAREELTTFRRQVYYVGAGKAALALIAISAAFLAASVWVVRIREYATDRAAGS
ncbi:MAG: ABC transporter permease [Candidatus Hydrogenedentes bacterium]|nr:ABC transporter permease [Candidatus Hydrogenedentota bacterium]